MSWNISTTAVSVLSLGCAGVAPYADDIAKTANSELVIIDRLHSFIIHTSFYKNSLILSTAVL